MNTNACFFSLLRSGLWGISPDESLFKEGETDWEGIFRLATIQTVPALVFDGMEKLPSELRPARPLFMKWFSVVTRIEQANDKLNRELANIHRLYDENGIRFILLKGQGSASTYLRPEHRQCGDLDLYVGMENYKKVNKLVVAQSIELEPETEKHISFIYNNVHIENHRHAALFYNPVQNIKLRQFIKRWFKSPGKTLTVYDTDVALPAPGFNAVYLLLHILTHFIPEGIGLRQICDWTCTLKNYAGEIDRDRLVKEVTELDIEQAFCSFGYVAVNYLGLPAENFPFALNEKLGEFILSDILKGGNFGRGHIQNINRPQTKWKGKLYSFNYINDRCKRMKKICASEARWYPYYRIVSLVNKMAHGTE